MHVSTKIIYEANAKYKVTHFSAVPHVLNSIVNAPAEETSGVHSKLAPHHFFYK